VAASGLVEGEFSSVEHAQDVRVAVEKELVLAHLDLGAAKLWKKNFVACLHAGCQHGAVLRVRMRMRVRVRVRVRVCARANGSE
jgi:hypothetical protein